MDRLEAAADELTREEYPELKAELTDTQLAHKIQPHGDYGSRYEALGLITTPTVEEVLPHLLAALRREEYVEAIELVLGRSLTSVELAHDKQVGVLMRVAAVEGFRSLVALVLIDIGIFIPLGKSEETQLKIPD